MKTASFFTYTGPGRISIALWAPRGFRDLPAYRGLAPHQEMLKLAYGDYTPRYAESLRRLDPEQVWIELHRLAAPHEPVLLCWERPPFSQDNFCHRHLAADWLEKALGVEIPELEIRTRSDDGQLAFDLG